jgi:hypothetical protein
MRSSNIISNMVVGAGSIFALGGNYFRTSNKIFTKNSDIKAVESDWRAVGSDIEQAIYLSQKNPPKNDPSRKRSSKQ